MNCRSGAASRWDASNGFVRAIVSGWQINTLTEHYERNAF